MGWDPSLSDRREELGEECGRGRGVYRRGVGAEVYPCIEEKSQMKNVIEENVTLYR